MKSCPPRLASLSAICALVIVWPSHGVAQGDADYPTLLDNVLAQAAAFSARLLNTARNLNRIDGSISIEMNRSIGEIAGYAPKLVNDTGWFATGGSSTLGASVFAVSATGMSLALFDPRQAVTGDLFSTAIGSLQSGFINGDLYGSFLVSGITSDMAGAAASDMTAAQLQAQQHGMIAQAIALQNVSDNRGFVDGSVSVTTHDVDIRVGRIATTVIGALQSGMVTADVTGGLGQRTNDITAQILATLVGSTAR